jgi:hypothetical protein
MSSLRAHVKNGRIILDEPTTLPEGTVLDLVLDDEGDQLDEEERKARDAAIQRAWASAQTGKGKTAAEVINNLRRTR